MAATGNSMEFCLPTGAGGLETTWHIPSIWNAFERNRARAYVLAFNLAAIQEHTDRAFALLKRGHTEVATPMAALDERERLGVGLWGASRGFLAHWARICGGRIDNYQLSIPSRVNAGTRTPWGQLGPCEQAVLNTPIIESNFTGEHNFSGIDIHRAIQSFDPCMSCTTHILFTRSGNVLDGVVDTGFPI
jgi:hydrogenase large subunit